MSECIECGSTENIDEHHTSYNPEKTLPLCRSCHQKVHGDESHPLYPDDNADTTVIEITVEQKAELNKMSRGSYKAAVQELLESYDIEKEALLTDAQRGECREIALDVVNDRVIREALE